jgi:hypothetical protein
LIYDPKSEGWLKSWQTLEGNQINFNLEVTTAASEYATDFHKEIDKAVCHIGNTMHKRRFLALSGGMDSEYIANALVRNKIEFTPVLLSIDNYNAGELWYAEHWCKKNNITPIRITADTKKLLNYIEAQCVPKYLTVNLGGYINVFLADYISNAYSGILITGCGDPTVNPSGIYHEGKVTEEDPNFYYWDIDIVLDILRPKQHPRAVISYFPDTLHSYVHNYKIELTEQENKAIIYDIPIRPKLDVFDKVPEWTKYMSDMCRFTRTNNFKLGTKYQTLNWLTKKRKSL